MPPIVEGDTLTLTYDVSLDYFSGVEHRLEALNRLLSIPGLPQEVDVEVLNQGHSILVEIVRQIEALQARLKS